MAPENPENPEKYNIDQNNTYLVTIGRMNPPHSGHLKIIQTMLDYANENNINPENINVILSHTQDSKKNPLFCEEEKKEILRLMINYKFGEIPINIMCMAQKPNHPILTRMFEILNRYNDEQKKIILFIGEDRAKSYKFIEKSIQPHIFETFVLNRDEDSVSATKMRQYALENTDESFDEYLKNALNIKEEEIEEFKSNPENEEIIEIIRMVFDRVGIVLLEQEQKRLTRKRKNTPSGGKKRKTKKRKMKKEKSKRKMKKRKSKKTKKRKQYK